MPTLIFRFKRLLAITCFLAAQWSPAFAVQPDEGWWVVVGVMPEGNFDASSSLRRRIRGCGYDPFNDFSDKFTGFRGGLTVFVLGAYPDKADAAAVLRRVKLCVPDAYMKHGRYLGE